jgi:hypothetical protein
MGHARATPLAGNFGKAGPLSLKEKHETRAGAAGF